jgi:hypothetical protein
MAGTGSGSCPIVGFHIVSAETSATASTTTMLFTHFSTVYIFLYDINSKSQHWT